MGSGTSSPSSGSRGPSTSFVWFFSATHGLEFDKDKRWTGKISDGVVRVRLGFLAERALTADEASAFTKIVQARVPFKLDAAITRVVQCNYILRARRAGHPGEDVLGSIPTIGYVRGEKEFAAVPDDLMHKARWAKAQGHSVDIADHPDAESAVRGIASDGRVRQHLLAAVEHLLDANPVPEVVSFIDHSIGILETLQGMVERHRDEIEANLERHHRHWADVLRYLEGMTDWAQWLLNHPSALKRKTVKLVREEPAKADDQATREAIFDRVAVAIERARKGEAIKGGPRHPLEVYANEVLETPPVVLLVAPTGSRKSTLMRAAAVLYVVENPDKTVVILMPRHRLGDEQIEMLHKEHPGGNFNAAVWRGRHADDPDSPDPERPGKFLPMCQRSEEAEELEKLMLDVEHHLCKQGRGAKAIKCPLYDVCAYQQQKQIAADIWFGAHELAVHEMPKVFGNVGWVIFDESPLDAFTFGVDINDQFTLELDALRSPLTPAFEKVVDAHIFLKPGRDALYEALDKLRVPIDRHKGVPVSNQSLVDFYGETLYGARAKNWQAKRQYQFSSSGHRLNYGNYSTASDYVHFTRRHDAHQFYGLEWRGKVVPDIRPNMTKKQVCKELEKAAGNSTVKKRATLWQLIEQVCEAENRLHDLIRQARDEERRKLIKQSYENRLYGRVQIHQGKEGRVIASKIQSL